MAPRLQSVLLLLISLYSALSLGSQYSPYSSSQNALTTCLAAASVPYASRNSAQWTQDTKPYNLRLTYTPAAVAIPTTTKHIQAAVRCGNKNGVRISAKGGGHSYASFGYGGEDGHLVIVLDAMDKVTLNKHMSCNIQAGARLGHVAYELFNLDHRALSHGSCPGVGISGHALHGGYGLASRTYGLTLDNFIGATVVLANGSTVYTAVWERPNLFWALRGAGSSFGIVAELDFMTFKAPETVTPYTIELDWDEDDAVEGLLALQKLATEAPRELNMQIYMAPTGQTIQGVYYGDRDGLNAALRPFLGEINAQISKANTTGWLEGLEYFADGQALDQRRPYNSHSTFYKTSLLTNALTRSQVKSLVGALFDNAKDPSARHSWYLLLDLYGGPNSAVSDKAPSDTAYVHRDKLLLYQFSDRGSSNGEYPEEGFNLLKGFQGSVTSSMDDGEWGMYANYLDSELDGETAARLYYGENLGRLRRIKAEYDPDDIFWNPQGIRPAKPLKFPFVEGDRSRSEVCEVWKLDLASFDSVESLSKKTNTLERIDALIENAGVALVDKTLLEGIEMSVKINVLATMLLGIRALPRLQESARASGIKPRLVSVAVEKLDGDIFEALSREDASMAGRYPLTKLLQFYAAQQMASLYPISETGVVTNILNPGLCTTELNRSSGGLLGL
ncbi:hypothetical protein FZEAL_10353 [Fusarium zealandicum]|uniref:FAD-binding PCMH-type domain-containing protein n=1 Tax=Fusarium zealandicum TaxID=1053134 RepID=A0A8H4XC00_9HYPO|nr:hypothetical protein FZEAL_10353 [Fusarium zealandicum]